jgi:hypothetical protein
MRVYHTEGKHQASWSWLTPTGPIQSVPAVRAAGAWMNQGELQRIDVPVTEK